MITKDSSMRCDLLVFLGCYDLCNNFARWLQNSVACDVMCWFSWGAMIFCNNFMLPKRRFWKPGKHFGPSFWAHFQVRVAQNEYSHPWNSAQTGGPKWFSGFQNLRLGSINLARWLQKSVACDVVCWFSWGAMNLWSFVTTLQDDYKR